MITKIIITYAWISLWALATYAQENNDSMLYAKKAESALQTKRVGATFTILGIAAIIAGTVGVNNLNTSAGIEIAGLVTTAIGVPMWIVGSNNYNKYTKRSQELTVRLNVTPRQQGLTLRLRF